MNIYKPGQVKEFLPFVPEDVRWFLLGGPADGDEAQVFAKKRPGAKIIGWEPNPVMYQVQMVRGFPGDLHPFALWSEPARLELRAGSTSDDATQRERSSSLTKYLPGVPSYGVDADSLDNFSDKFGPYDRAALWLDIEGAELRAIQGASKLLERCAIVAINIEVFRETEVSVAAFLSSCSFEERHRWDHHVQGPASDQHADATDARREWWNAVWTLKGCGT